MQSQPVQTQHKSAQSGTEAFQLLMQEAISRGTRWVNMGFKGQRSDLNGQLKTGARVDGKFGEEE